MTHKKGSKTKEASCEDFPCGICRSNCTAFSIQSFKCLIWFHVRRKSSCRGNLDLSEENFRTLGNINGCFWACLRCRNQVVIPQDQSNIKDELFQKIEDMKNNLKSEIESFKTEIRDCIRNVHINMNSKIFETEKQLSSKTPSDKNQIQKSENQNKLILFGVAEKTKDSRGTLSFVELISYDKKSRRDCTLLRN